MDNPNTSYQLRVQSILPSINKKNEMKIIQLLLASDNYISSYEIANSTGISRRRVRDEMRSVKDILASLHLNLLSKASQGYYIEGKSSQNLTELQNILAQRGMKIEQAFSDFSGKPANSSHLQLMVYSTKYRY